MKPIKEQFADNITFHWDGRTGTLLDQSGNGNDGTVIGSPYWSNSADGIVLNFDGEADAVKFGNDASLNVGPTFSFGSWFKQKATSNQATPMSHTALGTAGWHIFQDNGNNFAVFVYDFAVDFKQAAIPFPIEQWVFISCSSTPTITELFMNGNSLGSSSKGAGAYAHPATAELMIGAASTGDDATPDDFFKGAVREGIEFDIALSGAQWAQFYDESLQEGLVNSLPKRRFQLPGQVTSVNYNSNLIGEPVTLGSALGAGEPISDGKVQTGTWKISVDSTGKHFDCVTDGQIKIPLQGASGFTTDTFSISGTPTLTKNANDLQLDAVAGEKIYSIIITT